MFKYILIGVICFIYDLYVLEFYLFSNLFW